MENKFDSFYLSNKEIKELWKTYSPALKRGGYVKNKERAASYWTLRKYAHGIYEDSMGEGDTRLLEVGQDARWDALHPTFRRSWQDQPD